MSDLNKKTCAVIGAGSIGERCIRNLWQLGYRDILVFRQRNLPFRDIGDAEVRVITDWQELLSLRPYAAFVCSPTHLHLSQTTSLIRHGIHTLVEKPLSHTADGMEELEELLAQGKALLWVGYMMRQHPILKILKQIIEDKTFGNLISMQSKWAEYLPDWHPWEDYRQSYAAREDMGGGVALTLSHDIDMVNWLSGSSVSRSAIFKNYRSALEVDTEAGAEIMLQYENGITASLHLNYYEKSKERFLKLVFDDASFSVDFFEASLTKKAEGKTETRHFPDFDRNQLFIHQLQAFMKKTTDFLPEDSLRHLQESKQIISICHGQ
jgi:predicted dehydrogenase